jgi:hypothetical protein
VNDVLLQRELKHSEVKAGVELRFAASLGNADTVKHLLAKGFSVDAGVGTNDWLEKACPSVLLYHASVNEFCWVKV